MKSICFTGGGSSGHVTPNIAIINKLKKDGLFYIGSFDGIEKNLIQKENIPYYAISSGKLRRYFSWQNFIDPFKILWGTVQAYFVLRSQKPSVVFSKGGFITFPVALAAKLNKIPVVCHESDFIPGLANKLVFPLADKICLTFAESKKNIKYKNKTIITGAPIRENFFIKTGDEFLTKYNLDQNKKSILITGGGLGAAIINQTIYQCLDTLLKKFNIIHITGKGKINPNIKHKNYIQVEYLTDDMFSAMALADLVVSRAGSNTLYELISLKKKNILIPLSLKASRGDQIHNAEFFRNKELSYVLQEEKLNKESLLKIIEDVFSKELAYDQRLENYSCPNGAETIVKLLKQYCGEEKND